MMVQGNSVSVIGNFKDLRKVKRVVKDTMMNKEIMKNENSSDFCLNSKK